MSQETAILLHIRDTFIQLLEYIESFKKSILNDNYLPAWVMLEQEVDSDHCRLKAANIISQLTYQPQQNKQQTNKLTGIIGISEKTLQLGKEVNNLKNKFKLAMQSYRAIYGNDITTTEATSDKLRRSVLGGLNFQDIHFVQSYRKIRLFPIAPLKIRFSWSSRHTGTVRLSPKKAIEHLQNKYLTTSNIAKDIDFLQQLPDSETIIIKRHLIPHLRANLSWSKEIESSRLHDAKIKKAFPKQINTPMPIFIVITKGQLLPDFNQVKSLKEQTMKERLQRKDVRLEQINTNIMSNIYHDI